MEEPMSEIRVNTNELSSGSQILSATAQKIAETQKHVSNASSVGNAYDGQLAQALASITDSVQASGSSLQNRSSELSAELIMRANKFEAANDVSNNIANSIASKISDFIENSPILSKLFSFNKTDMGKAAFIWGMGGLGFGGIFSFITFMPDIRSFFTHNPNSTSTLTQSLTGDPVPPPIVSQLPSQSTSLGKLSQKYESNGDPGRVSSGAGDKGGASYGAYQMTSSGGGTVARFLKSSAGAPWASEFANLKPGSKEFTAKWQEIAKREPDRFLAAQHEFIKQSHYDPFVEKLKTIGLRVESRSQALQDVVWSTAVQHGSANDVISTALAGRDPAKLSDEELIRAIYAERGCKNPDGTLARFAGNSIAVQKGVAKRFEKELNDALVMLSKEKK